MSEHPREQPEPQGRGISACWGPSELSREQSGLDWVSGCRAAGTLRNAAASQIRKRDCARNSRRSSASPAFTSLAAIRSQRSCFSRANAARCDATAHPIWPSNQCCSNCDARICRALCAAVRWRTLNVSRSRLIASEASFDQFES